MAKPETSEQQQSYFYVVWPEERSPAAAATAPAATNLITMNTAPSIGAAAGSLTTIDTLIQSSNSSPPICSGLGTHPVPGVVPSLPLLSATGHPSPAIATPRTVSTAAASGTDDSDSSDAGSPAASSVNQSTTATVTELQTITITDSGEFSGSLPPITSSTPHNLLISPKTHPFGLTANGTGSLTTVYNPVSSPGVIYVSDASSIIPRSHPPGPIHRGNGSSIGVSSASASAMLHPAVENQRKQRHSHHSTEQHTFKCIGTWAELALGNLHKILKEVSSHEESSEDGGPPRKRVCIREVGTPSQTDCLECEVKDAEINVLRKRVLALQEQMIAMVSPSTPSVIQHKLSNGSFKPPMSPSLASPTPQQMETTIHLQMDPMHPMTKELLQVRKRSRLSSEHTAMAEALSSTAPPDPQPGEAIELVSGSGVYILAYRLDEARREAKTGTQLARKLMDCFWDKDTLAKSTLTPRSKFQYQQLDPKVIKAIEVYCLSYDNTVHAKDIHATMTDKCCQARSRYRVLQ